MLPEGRTVLLVRRCRRTRLLLESLAFFWKALLFSLVLCFAVVESVNGETVRVAEDGDFTTIQVFTGLFIFISVANA